MLNRETAIDLFYSFTETPGLRHHGLCVEAAMRWYARELSGNEVLWGLTGLLHDFDYEKYPLPEEPEGHPFKGVSILKERGYPAEMLQAILGHCHHTGVPRDTLLAKALFACDELCGFINAVALVRPSRSFDDLKPSSVKKKFKDKAFAKGCNRDDMRQGAQDLGVGIEKHISNIIESFKEAGLQPS